MCNCALGFQPLSHLSHSGGGLGEAFPPRQAVVSLLQGRQPLLLLEQKENCSAKVQTALMCSCVSRSCSK